MGDLADRRIKFNILEREIVLLERDRQGGQALTRNRHGKAYVRLIVKAKMIGAYTRADQIIDQFVHAYRGVIVHKDRFIPQILYRDFFFISQTMCARYCKAGLFLKQRHCRQVVPVF